MLTELANQFPEKELGMMDIFLLLQQQNLSKDTSCLEALDLTSVYLPEVQSKFTNTALSTIAEETSTFRDYSNSNYTQTTTSDSRTYCTPYSSQECTGYHPTFCPTTTEITDDSSGTGISSYSGTTGRDFVKMEKLKKKYSAEYLDLSTLKQMDSINSFMTFFSDEIDESISMTYSDSLTSTQKTIIKNKLVAKLSSQLMKSSVNDGYFWGAHCYIVNFFD